MRQLAILALWTAAAQAQPGPNLMANMQTISQALGVNCEYCHSAPRGSGQPEPKKEIARAMMAMTREINAKVQAASGGTNATGVECVTCHRGVAIPRQLDDILNATIREKGVAAAVVQYRELRKQYYGRQSYDFGEGTLLAIAQRITASKPDDAIALLQLNIEFYPQSVQSYGALAYAYTRKFDDQTAMKYFEKALEIQPENGIIRGQLEQLKSYRRNR
ncbi:MAG: photosynthetic reaction center cytochrome c subunit [Acidobacteriia bacterium]|nr:photosynthetic reaction center cytochrome c subunit [Terriglobia bacterium]